MDCSLPGSSVHGISQARILEQVAISFSRGSFWPRDQPHISCVYCIVRHVLYHWATREVLKILLQLINEDLPYTSHSKYKIYSILNYELSVIIYLLSLVNGNLGFITYQVYTVSKGQSITEPKLLVGPNCPKRLPRQVLFVGLRYHTYLKILQNFRHSSVTVLKNANSQPYHIINKYLRVICPSANFYQHKGKTW